MHKNSDYIAPKFLPLGQIVSHNALSSPNVVATTQDGSETTWAELDVFSNQIAHGFVAEGIQAGARVAYLGKTTDVAFQIMHGVAKANCIFTPVNWRLAPREVAYILKDAQAEFLFVEEEFIPLAEDVLRNHVQPKSHIVLAHQAKQGGKAFQQWRDSNPSHKPDMEIVTDDVVLQLYTSGTTGNPKGALITHDFVINAGKTWYACEEDVFGMLPGEEHLNYMPIFHNSGAVSAHYGPFSRGCGIVILPDFDLDLVLEYIDKRSIPWIQGVPTMLQMFLTHPKASRTDFSNIRYVVYGGAPMPIPLRDSLVEHFGGCRFVQGYGATEALSITMLAPKDHEAESERLSSVGRTMSGVEIKIVDPDGIELPVGAVGEVAVRSSTMAVGYWNLPEATAKAFKDGWYLTGDGGCLDEDGYLYLKERIKDMIISGGENIYPGEVENVLYAHPSVESAAVVAVADEKWGEVPLAFIVVKDGCSFEPEDLRSYSAARLAKYKQPKFYEPIDELPLNMSGKILKKELRDLAKTLQTPGVENSE